MIEIIGPASLPLGLVQVADAGQTKTCLVGVTLQHPPVHLTTRADRKLHITGARADAAHQQAQRFLQHYQLQPQAEIQIELAIPNFVGLGSEALLGLSVARSLAWLHDLPLDDTLALATALGIGPQHALEVWGFDQGGLLFVEAASQADTTTLPPVVRRYEIAHPDKKTWVFVFYFPRVPAGTSATFEHNHLATLLQAAPYVSAETAQVVSDSLWPALANDDIATFAQALQQIQQFNQAALAQAGTPLTLTTDEQTILDLMRDQGALAWGRSPTGVALYGLIEGATAAVALRKQLRHHVGPFGGRVMAAITSNTGAQHTVSQ